MHEIRFDGILDYTINNIGFVNVFRDKGHTVPYKNGKDRYSLILIAAGELDYYFIQKNFTVKLVPGEVLFIPKNHPYIATYAKDGTVAKVLNFDINFNVLYPFLCEPLHKKKSAFFEICRSISGENANSIVFLASKIYELLYIIEKTAIEVPDKFKKIIPAITEVQQNYFENKKVSHYSDICNMSESNFRKLFREYTGHSLIEYRNLIRIAEAKKMIESKEYTVVEAAYLTGFNNMSFFYNVYNKSFSKE